LVPPSAAASVSTTVVSSQQIKLTWSAAKDDVAVGSYRIFRGLSRTALTQVATAYSTASSYTDYPVNPATPFYYGVETVDTSGNVSVMSTFVAAKT
jgi:hypothetical protein